MTKVNDTAAIGVDITKSTFGQSPAAAGLDLSAEIIVRMPFRDIAEYQGTRAALEAEGVIPACTKWPDGFDELRWEDEKFRYRLRRERPEGVKGPRKQLMNIDWWMFRCRPINATPADVSEVERKKKELSDTLYRQSAKGRAEWERRWKRYCETREDEKFQAFKALIPGLVAPKRGRPSKKAVGTP